LTLVKLDIEAALKRRAPAPAGFGLGSEFDNFLFASIAEDWNGIPLSVVSLLGRMDLDPWQEAASLAGLPAADATQRLTSLLGHLPAPPLQQPDFHTTAARLVALLPHRPQLDIPPSQAPASGGAPTRARRITNRILVAIYLTIMLATQFVITRLELTRTDAAQAPASLTAPSQTPSPTSAK
jgi:hypothetical protein